MQLAKNMRKFQGMMINYSFSSQATSYYKILGVNQHATKEEILEAYSNKAKKFVPRVSTTSEPLESNSAQEFRQLAEAYAVLSHQESRNNYDLLNKRQPERVYSEIRNEQNRKFNDRSFDGQQKKQHYAPGTFAEERQKVLAEERAKFNVNFLGRYNGGLPQKNKGIVRGSAQGSALGPPGAHHDVLVHRTKTSNGSDYQDVTNEMANDFSQYQGQSRYEVERRWPAFQAEVDYDYFKFNHYRTAWRYFRNIAIIFLGIPALAHIFGRYRNSIALYEFETAKQNDPDASVKIFGQKVVVGKTGTIKFA
ncbi:DnaJ domain [Pseudocohnilembus persalinus]|uniref:DnaJ domain n=1 Tax=Pseudocohnilembus persalinus TaxID=266149 RepID=A0A0V0R2W4_PSEPJ|nr:DnaJ domain [Pseudocohnilembus persalinus]|eukprot:KRX08624.1 DnaJ domain [Pseudocohnilembus persalinus]